MNEVLAIIVTYNRKKLLQECLNALLTQKMSCDILLIDNASNDGTEEMIKNEYSFIKYYNTKKNMGGAGGYNIGLKEACKYEYKYLWLMDDDSIVEKDALEKLLEASEKLHNEWGFLSSKVLWVNNEICKTNVQRRKVAKKNNDFNTPIVNVDYASFVSLFIKKDDVMKIGLPIKDFFIWTDDLEYTRRLTIKNKFVKNYIPHKGYLVNDSIVIHKCKENIGVDITKDSIDRLDRYKYIYRNDIYTFKREGILGIIFLIIRYIYHIFKILFNGKNKLLKIKIMTIGNIEGIFFNPMIEYVE